MQEPEAASDPPLQHLWKMCDAHGPSLPVDGQLCSAPNTQILHVLSILDMYGNAARRRQLRLVGGAL